MTSPVTVDAAGAAGLLVPVRPLTVLCHVDPDADAIGSAAAVGLALGSAGREVAVTFDPGEVPGPLTAIPGADLVRPLSGVEPHDGLVVVVDCASPQRCGGAVDLLDSATEVLVIDHHRSNSGFGTHLLLDPGAASTTSLVLDVLDSAGLPPGPEVATCLYAGLVTDTGSFRWGGPAAHTTASRLLELGAEAERMSFELLDARDSGWLAIKSEILSSHRIDPGAAAGRGVVWLTVTADQVGRAGSGAVETLVDEIRGIRDTAVAVVLRERGPDRWSVSMRSREGVDVGRVAVALGGGGHGAAAGCTLSGTCESVTRRVRDALG